MKKTLRSAMLSTICMLVVAVMSLTGVTYAWFTQATTAEVNGMTMEVAAAGAGLEVSKDGTNWGSTVEFTTNQDEDLIPVSTVDAKVFYKATANPDNTNITAEEASADNYWTSNLWIRNTGTNSITIKLDAAAGDIFKQNGDERETYLAARVAIFKVDGQTETLQYIYGDESYLGVKGTGTFDSAAESGVNQLGAVSNYQTDPAACLLAIPGATNGEPQPVQYKIVVWLEGQDEQCVSNNANAAFDVELNFAVVE